MRSLFLAKFLAHRTLPKTYSDIMELRMRWNENVTQFAKRYWTIYSQIEHSNDEVAVKAFKQALLPTCPLRKKLAGNLPTTVEALMARVNKYIAQEED